MNDAYDPKLNVVPAMMELLAQDLRNAFRTLWKSPGFTAVVAITLALGIGANTAVFSVVDAVLLRPLPLRDPDHLVMLWEKNPTLGHMVGDRVPTAYANFQEWVRQAHSFEGIAGFEDVGLNRTGSAEPEYLAGARVSPNFFQVLGVSPLLGNAFDAVISHPSQSHVAVLSNAYWQSHFGASPGVLGQILTLNDQQYTVTGVLPASFHLPATRQGTEQRKPDVWIPYDPTGESSVQELNRRRMQVFARLRPGVSLAEARAEMDLIAKRLEAENPTLNAGFGANVFPVYVEDIGQEFQRNLLVLLCAVGLLLLLACANLANLLLTQAIARQKELAIRKALGANRFQLIRQMLTESLLLSFLGGLLGLGVAYLGLQAMLALKPADIHRPEDIHLSAAVLVFTLLTSALAGLLFGTLPAVYVSRADVNTILKGNIGAEHPVRTRALLVMGEVGLASVLLLGAAFMGRSLESVLHVDPGFRADHLLTMRFSPPPSRYRNNEKNALFCRQVLERVSALPGVKSASFADGLPMTRIRMMKFLVEGQPVPKRGSEPTADMRGITSPEYFETLGIPIIEGRNFTQDEIDEHAPLVIVNQSLAHRLWPNESAVGKHIRNVAIGPNGNSLELTVIGVIGNTRQLSLESATRPEITRPMVDYTVLTLAVRSSSESTQLTSAIEKQIWAIDKDLPVFDVASMQEIVDENLGDRRFDSFLMALFGGLGLALAAVGIYGVLASAVEQRTQEIGIRVALGARPGNVMNMVLGQGMRLVLIGMLVGFACGFVLARIVASLFFGVSATSLGIYFAVATVLAMVALIAAFLPAYRALKVDPMVALRYE